MSSILISTLLPCSKGDATTTVYPPHLVGAAGFLSGDPFSLFTNLLANILELLVHCITFSVKSDREGLQVMVELVQVFSSALKLRRVNSCGQRVERCNCDLEHCLLSFRSGRCGKGLDVCCLDADHHIIEGDILP